MKNNNTFCQACEAYQAEQVAPTCPDHEVEMVEFTEEDYALMKEDDLYQGIEQHESFWTDERVGA